MHQRCPVCGDDQADNDFSWNPGLQQGFISEQKVTKHTDPNDRNKHDTHSASKDSLLVRLWIDPHVEGYPDEQACSCKWEN